MIRLLFVVLLLSSCATTQIPYEIDHDRYQDETVTVSATVDLAYASYLAGCVDIFHLNGQKKVYKECQNRAKKYVEENVISILESEESP
jgi:hypothetical protein